MKRYRQLKAFVYMMIFFLIMFLMLLLMSCGPAGGNFPPPQITIINESNSSIKITIEHDRYQVYPNYSNNNFYKYNQAGGK